MSKPAYWQRTQVQGLLRNAKSGLYYGRTKIGGKPKWMPLKTDVFSVAKLRWTDEQAKIHKQRVSIRTLGGGGDCTMADMFAAYMAQVKARQDIRESTKDYHLKTLKKVTKTWPDLALMKPSAVTREMVADWAARFKRDGTQFIAKGTKTVRAGNSAKSVNGAIDALRRVMEMAALRGATAVNPVSRHAPSGERLKMKAEAAKLNLPSRQQIDALLAAMEDNGSINGSGREGADMCRFMMRSGSRIGELRAAHWGHIDWEKKTMFINGGKTASSRRTIPLFPGLEEFLLGLKERRIAEARWRRDGRALIDKTDKLFRYDDCQRTIDSAVKRSGCPAMTHHDFRHVFATVCIESGVDIPTVSRWLGHADGGALAMKTYGHLRDDHSQQQAKRVNFGNAQ